MVVSGQENLKSRQVKEVTWVAWINKSHILTSFLIFHLINICKWACKAEAAEVRLLSLNTFAASNNWLS